MKQGLIAVAVIVALVLMVAAASYFGGSTARKGGFDKGQRFKAKPGTTRKNAMLLTSNKRTSTDDPKAAIARRGDEQEDDSPLTIKSLSKPSDEKRAQPARDRAMKALNSASPETGLRSLDAALALPHDRLQGAYLYEAMGQLYAQLDPPDYEKAMAAFEEARAMADDVEMAQNILLKSVQVLMQGGLDDEARAQLEAGSGDEALSTETQFRLHLLWGQLEERAGKAVEAERMYRKVLDGALALPESLERKMALGLARSAGLRLTRLYRANDRDGAAKSLTLDLKKQLKALSKTT
ncbi:MAG: soluble NSF attachment family protein [Candidatus Hydrogenedentes bacterium]|nr:soluble NSF attachment family protein [Candidatus Hydrogenedentota bacterium]